MNSLNRLICGLLLMACALCLQSQARADGDSLPGTDARYFLQDNSEQIRAQIEALRLRQLQRDESIQQAIPPVDRPAEGLPDATCLHIHALYLSGITLLDADALATLKLPQAQCLSHAVMTRLIHDLNALYLVRGWIAARVLPQISDGVMTLHVIEGRVDRILGSQPGMFWLFPGMLGRPLNIRDLEQGLDQANRLQSEHLHADVLPGQALGESTIRLSDATTSPWRGALSLDNRGYDSTGRRSAGVNLVRDNPSGYFDFFSLSLERSLSEVRFSHRSSIFYSIPYGYWTFSAFAAQSEYLNPQKLQFNTVKLSGASSQFGVRVDRVLARDQTHIGSVFLQLAHKRVRNYFLDSLQQISSPTLSVLELGLNRLSLLPHGALSLEGALEKGVPWFGAQRDWHAPDAGLPRAQFTKVRLSIGGHQGVMLKPVPLSFESRFNWQASRQRLPAIEQLELADNSQVRGYRHNSLASEVGWSWHNTLSSTHRWPWMSVTPRLALDGGRVLMRESSRSYQNLLGAGMGVILRHAGISLDLEYSRPLIHPKEFVHEVRQLLARFNWEF